jgi:predicted glutamine amidotransferase
LTCAIRSIDCISRLLTFTIRNEDSSICGLTGAARHPDAPNLDLTLAIVTLLLKRTEHRGHHATGLAAINSSNPFIFKKAVEASKLIASDPYRATIASVAPDTQVLLGHTRHATHANAHDDYAAHPFQIGSVIGAHNGIINNWREVEQKLRESRVKKFGPDGLKDYPVWVNDSQAAFGVLDAYKKPEDALDQLDGYMALTWVRGKSLFMCRTNSAPLSAAYVPMMRTMFWNSETDTLNRALLDSGLTKKDIELWVLRPNTLYRYQPTAFTANGTHVERRDLAFRGIGQRTKQIHFNSARPNESWSGATTGTYVGTGSRVRDTLADIRERNEKTQSLLGGQFLSRDATMADARRAAQRELDVPNESRSDGRPKKPRVWSMDDIEREFQKLWVIVRDQAQQLETLEAEKEHLYAIMNEIMPNAFETVMVPDDDTADAAMADADNELAASVNGNVPHAEPGTCEPIPDDVECVECGLGGEKGPMLRLPDQTYIHDTCVFNKMKATTTT